MGLMVTAYAGIEVVGSECLDAFGVTNNTRIEWTPDVNWTEENYPGRTDGLLSNATYRWDSKCLFEVGNYSSYNLWRDNLERFANEQGVGFFEELIDFPDNEGVMGPYIARKLANDFEELSYLAVAFSKELPSEGQEWLKQYRKFQKIFNAAADDGAIEFG